MRDVRRAHDVLLGLLVLVCGACGDSRAPRDAAVSPDALEDANVDAAIELRIDPPAPPMDAERTSFAPCPPGWSIVITAGGAEACEAWPGGAPPECGPYEMALPGEECAPLGPPCAADGWPADLPSENVVYVRADAAPGGDGTRGRPFDRLGSGASAARPGDTIALAVGVYDESVALRERVTLQGACVADTRVRGRTSFADVTVAARGPGAVLRGVHVSSRDRGVSVYAGAQLLIEDALVEGDVIPIQVAQTSALETANVLVRGGDVSGIDADGATSVTLSRTVVVGSLGTGINVGALESVASSAVVLTDVAAVDHPAGGVVLRDLPGSTLSVQRYAADACALAGVYAGEATATLEDVAIHASRRAGASGMAVAGAVLFDGADATVRRLFVDDGDDFATLVAASTLDADGLVVRGFTTILDEIGAIHLDDSTMTARHVHIEDTATAAALGLSRSSLRLEDAVLVDLSAPETMTGGIGLHVIGEGSTATAQRVRVTRATNVAINVARGGELDLRDVVVEETRSSSLGIGYAFQILDGSRLGLDRADIAGSIGTAIYVSGSARLADVSVRDTAGIDVRDRRGAGLIVLRDGELPPVVTAERLRVRGSVLDAVIVYGVGASLTASDLEIGDVTAAVCDELACPSGSGGSGLICAADAFLDVDGLLVERAAFAGLLWADRCVARARDGLVRDNAFGLLNDATVDLGDALQGVSIIDNEVDFQTTTLTVEAPTPPPVLE